MIAWMLATIISFCPVTSASDITGYHCWAYALQRDFGSQPCEPGLCVDGIAEGDAAHQFRVLGCSVDEVAGTLFLGPEAPNEFIMFSVEPEFQTTQCSPGGCASVWWIPSLDPNAPCVCPDGEC